MTFRSGATARPALLAAILSLGFQASLPGAACAQQTRPSARGESQAGGESQASELGVVIATEKGDIVLDLFEEDAPVTVAHFVNLARRGFYDGLKFHRVIDGFMIQGGDPKGTGRGGPGYRFEDETTPNRRHDAAGTLSMANAGPSTNGSQFFITHGPTPHLDGKHTVFGRVTKGQDVVDAIEKDDVMESVTVTGSPADLLRQQAERVAEWNAVLDADSPDERNTALAALDAAAAQRAAERNAEDDARQLAQALETVKTLGADPAKGRTTDSGLWIHVLSPGAGEKATPQDAVTAHATGLLADGTKFWSSHDTEQPMTQHPVTRFVPGFTEALQHLAAGGEAVVIIPGRLGYGDRGNARARIPGNATLVFKIEVLDVH